MTVEHISPTAAQALIEQGASLIDIRDADEYAREHIPAAQLWPLAALVKILEGGIEGWRRAGLLTVEDKSQPLPLMRQVQIAAGVLILLGVTLGYSVSSAFFLLSAFVGAGLTLAGVTGFCGMARLLAVMPWNRR